MSFFIGSVSLSHAPPEFHCPPLWMYIKFNLNGDENNATIVVYDEYGCKVMITIN